MDLPGLYLWDDWVVLLLKYNWIIEEYRVYELIQNEQQFHKLYSYRDCRNNPGLLDSGY